MIPAPTHSPFIYPKGTDVLSCNRLLLKNDTLYVLSSDSVTICTLPPFPLSFDLSLCVNCHGVRLAADAFQNHASDIFKIHEL